MKTAPRFLPLGSISTGTLRDRDILPELFWLGAARRLRMTRDDRKQFSAIETEWNEIEAEAEDDESADRMAEICEELYRVLETYAPPGTYLGSHPGDGADIGVWYVQDLPAVEFSGRETREERNAKLDSADQSGIGAGTVLEVSDHGNVLAVWQATYLSDRTVWRRVPDSCYR